MNFYLLKEFNERYKKEINENASLGDRIKFVNQSFREVAEKHLTKTHAIKREFEISEDTKK